MTSFLKTYAVTTLMLLFMAAPLYAASEKRIPELLPDTTVMLPADCNAGIRWVLPPLNADKARRQAVYGLRFSVDNLGRAFIGMNDSYILNAADSYVTAVSQPYRGFVHLDNGALIIATATDIGFIVPSQDIKRDKKGFPISVFQPIAKLPVPDAQIYKGAGDCLYIAGWDEASGGYAVYLLRPEDGPDAGATRKFIKGYKKVFASSEPINAVAGNGVVTFAAVGNSILRISEADQSVTKVCELADNIRSLAYDPNAGLFYSTGYEIGLVGHSGPIVFLKTREHEIYMQGGSLYILFKDTWGVLAIDRASRLGLRDAELPDAAGPSQDDVRIARLCFYEAGPPDYQGKGYADKFERKKTHYVYCDVQMQLEKRTRKRLGHLVTIVWHGPCGKESSSESMVAVFGPKQRTANKKFYYGSDEADTFYPGRYTVDIFVDGAKSGEGGFTILGSATVWEAAHMGDTSTLEKLLDGGADPNKPEYGFTPLQEAVISGSARDVKLLLDHGADVNARDESGKTALMMSSISGTDKDAKDKVKLLIASGAGVNAADTNGNIALSSAMENSGSLEIADILVASGADVNAADSKGHSLLLNAIMSDVSPKYIEYLLTKGANPNLKDKDGVTPVSSAIISPRPEYVRLLVKHGADVNTPVAPYSSKRESLLHFALQGFLTDAEIDTATSQKYMEVARILIENGAVLLPGEEDIILDGRVAAWLGPRLLGTMLKENDRLLIKLKSSSDPVAVRLAANMLLDKAEDAAEKASQEHDYETALYYCSEARDAAENAGVDMPEVYRLCGVLEWVLGIPDKAGADLGKYLSLVPDAPDAQSIKKMLAQRGTE